METKWWPDDPISDGCTGTHNEAPISNWEESDVYLALSSAPGKFIVITLGVNDVAYPTASAALARMLALRLQGYVPFATDLAWLRRRIAEQQEEGATP